MTVTEAEAERAWQVLQTGRFQRRLKAKGFDFELFEEFSSPTEEGAKAHIIKNVFVWGETSAWIGPPGSLKSSLLADAAVSVASGRDWFGHKNKSIASVVYFALERADLVKRRLIATAARRGITGKLPIAVVPGIVDLARPASVDKVITTLKEVEVEFLDEEDHQGEYCGLAIFDTFAKVIAAGGGDEDKAKDQGAVFTNVQRIKDRMGGGGPHIALIGHTGKDESRGSRGSNAFLGDVDLMVTISGDKIKTATVTKANDAPEGPLFSFKSELYEFGIDDDGDPITVNIVSSEEVEREPTRRASRWTKGLKLVHDAITEAILNAGQDHRIGSDGPVVRAAPVTAARAIHTQRYVSNGEGDRSEAERKAWARNFKQARDAGLIGGELKGGQELIWLVS
jgi:hypothetical protein